MDLNQLYHDHQISLMRASATGSAQLRHAHHANAAGIAQRIEHIHRAAGAGAASRWEARYKSHDQQAEGRGREQVR